MIQTVYTEAYRRELSDYYAGFPHNVDAIADAITGWYDAHPDASSYRKRAESYRIMDEACEITIFPDFPLFFEIETGRGRFDWGCDSRLGRLLAASNAGRWTKPYAEEITPYREEWLFRGWNPVGLDHHCLCYEKLLEKGYAGLLRDIEDALSQGEDRRGGEFLHAAKAGCLTAIRFGERFAQKAQSMADDAADEAQRANLTAIADAASQIPAGGARTFREALNAILFAREMTGSLEGLGVSTLGRLDWLLWPYYQRDIAEGRFTPEEMRQEAKRLLHALLAYTEIRFDMDNGSHETSTTIYIGGTAPDGTPVMNTLSRLILEVYAEGRYFGTKLIARISSAHEPAWAELLGNFIAGGFNTLVIQNDDVLVDAHVRQGKTLTDARRYVGGGCHEILLGGCEVHTRADSWINVPLLLLKTLEKRDYADFTDLYLESMADIRAFHDTIAGIKNKYERMWPDCDPLPLASVSLDDCIEKRTDLSAGGARYNSVSLSMVGAATLIDSLYALREAVWGEHPFASLDEIKAALKADFAGYEALRRRLLALPKFGGAEGIPAGFCDKVLRDVSACAGQPNARGGHYLPAFYPHQLYIELGRKTGATPDGRGAGEVLSRGISPSESTEGAITDALGILGGLDLARFDDSFVCDLTLPYGSTDPAILAALIRSFLLEGGSSLQINTLNVGQLLEAKANPELHRDIVVRVCGYSEKFCFLSPAVQDEVIHRAVRSR